MSKLRKKLAEIQQLQDGTFLDTDTGEITETNPEDNNIDNGMNTKIYETVQNAQSIYPNNEYQNQWGKVSPINIIMKQYLSQLYNCTSGQQVADIVIPFIESCNKQFGALDKTYDYISQDYLNKLRYNLSKFRGASKAIDYLTNVYFKGIGMGMRRSSMRKRMTLKKIAELDNNQISLLSKLGDILDSINTECSNDEDFESIISNIFKSDISEIIDTIDSELDKTI